MPIPAMTKGAILESAEAKKRRARRRMRHISHSFSPPCTPGINVLSVDGLTLTKPNSPPSSNFGDICPAIASRRGVPDFQCAPNAPPSGLEYPLANVMAQSDD